jgi:hypothetical protein
MYEEVVSNNPLDNMGIKEVYFCPITVSIKYGVAFDKYGLNSISIGNKIISR